MGDQLTQQQRSAVENRGGPLLVSAAAGSGKTKVLVERLLSYLLDETAPCQIDDFLVITYTKAAAAELRGKIAARLSEYLAEHPDNRHIQRQTQRLYLAKISTVHAYCQDLLRQYACELELSGDFRMADENECRQLRTQAMEELLEESYAGGTENPKFRAFVDSQGLGRDDRLVPEIVLKVYDAARCHLDPDGWLSHARNSAAMEGVTDAAETVWGAYLMEDLREYLDAQTAAMERCAALAAEDEGLKKVTALLEQTVASLRYLREAQTWDEVVERRAVHYGTLRFPKKVEDPQLPDRIKAVREVCKKGLEKKLKVFCDPSAQVLADLSQTAEAVEGLVKLTEQFGLRYGQLKARRRILDFSDLEHRALDLLLGRHRGAPTRIAREEGQRFREVLVDEYQDSNQVQDAIFGALTKERGNCFMVGDVKQSIYRFRLADPGIFLEKYEKYPPAEDAAPGEGRKVMLSRNFRSGGAVLEGANDVFRRCMSRAVGDLDYGDEEALVEGVPHEPLGEPEVELHVLQSGEDSYRAEAAFVAERIRQLLDGTHMVRGKEGLRPIEPEDIAILLRSPGSVGQDYQDALSRAGIRSSFGSGRDLLQTAEAGFLRALLQVISNPRQDIPLVTVLASPVFAFTADDLARIRARQKHGDFYDALLLDDGEKTADFLTALESLRADARSQRLSQLLERIFCLTRIESVCAAMESGVERIANLRAFYTVAMEFETAAQRDLGQFLEHLELLEEKGMAMPETSSAGAVQILSIHKSKGLEYPVVFLCALSRSFNREDLRAPVLCDRALGLGLSAVDHGTRVRYPTIAKRAIVARTAKESLSEELRVLYVAMTRARDRLIMTYTAKTPEKELSSIACRLDIGGTELLARDVSCPGEWVLMEAMCRMEAGALFTLAGDRPGQLHLSDYPWRVETADAPLTDLRGGTEDTAAEHGAPEGVTDQLQAHLSFDYGHETATKTPSKQTATALKGRDKDQEAAEHTAPKPRKRTWRTFGGKTAGGKEYGTAMHLLMQYVRYERCTGEAGLLSELTRLTEAGILTPEQAAAADRGAVLAFFRTDIGRRMITEPIIREFKFSLLTDGADFVAGLEGEQILLQGVVDCALVEPDGITVVDFKTDYVTEETLSAVVEGYRPQVRAYAKALQRVYEAPVKGSWLYFFHLKRMVEV